jgi:hypothetical protein
VPTGEVSQSIENMDDFLMDRGGMRSGAAKSGAAAGKICRVFTQH